MFIFGHKKNQTSGVNPQQFIQLKEVLTISTLVDDVQRQTQSTVKWEEHELEALPFKETYLTDRSKLFHSHRKNQTRLHHLSTNSAYKSV